MATPPPRFRWALLLPLLLPAGAACRTVPDTRAAPTPQRPTLSSDTNTTAEDTWELEAGLALDPGDAYVTPVTMKHGLEEDTEVFASWAPLVHVEVRGGNDESGIGDLFLGLRHRLREEGEVRPSLAVQPSVKLPTADEDDGLGTGELDAGLAGIATKTFEGTAITAFYQLDALGSPEGGADVGHRLALAGSRPLEGFGVFSELALVWVPERDLEALFATFGGTTALSRSTVLDGGFVLGLSDDAPDFQLLVGMTTNLGQLRRPR